MIKYFNRQTNSYEIEQVAGDKYLQWTYSSPIGMKILELIIKKKIFSSMYGWFCESKLSRSKIQKFIDEFNISEDEFSNPKSDFKNFNNFFTRKLVQEARPINYNKDILISPGDGRLLAYENIDINKLIQVKGLTYNLIDLIQNKKLAKHYSNGTCIILRLCPTDYHRFHFIDDGVCDEIHSIEGSYYSVNPIALEKIPKLFCENKREYTILYSKNFGDIIYIDVGATCVGSIIQTYTPFNPIKKGEEKGYFKFGGSTIILFFEKNKIKIDSDIIEHTKKGFETKVHMGEKIGLKS
ncbi:phosphatidylserine decarboxylase [Clostridium aestuarii]|uniref:Phosphatidylserine decarboxylase proenzyme n=1 Tax=Clostridium aestuarii TaxID=338193 RepID=A0ABT4D3N0_9CLOT|nr:phosphatidylserine decarboxylase [Clostridium aestuarii]MCY6485854.1 phosphatidylserine decarboxylase [Clostridium aestuarii]